MPVFIHDQQDIYKKALSFALRADAIAQIIPRERFYLRNQLWRASSSVPFNIAEGGGGYSDKSRFHFYRIARGSAAECTAIFDYISGLRLVTADQLLYAEARELGAMLGAAIYKHLK